MRKIIWVAPMFGTLVWLSCGSVEPGAMVHMQDSSGVAIVTSIIDDEDAWPSCSISPKPLMRIGGRDAAPEYTLFSVEDARRLVDGRIAVVNASTSEVRVYDDSGKFEFSLGREGKGPGEFQAPVEVSVLSPDSIVVWDYELGRITIFDVDGKAIRSIRLDPMPFIPWFHFEIVPNNPHFIIVSRELNQVTGSEFVPQWIHLLRYSLEGLLLDTAATLQYGSRARVPIAERRQTVSPMFEARGAFAVVGDRIITASGVDPEVQVWDSRSALRRVIRWQPPDRTVSSADAERYKSEALASVNADFLRRERRIAHDMMPVSPQFPAVLSLEGDPEGFLWVRRYPRPGATVNSWLGFDGSGAFHCALTVPRHFSIMQFGGDFVLGKTTDEFDVEYVEIFALNRDLQH